MDKIKDYYLIGDLHCAALVSKNASIDWLCLPHFDSPSIFARLLDEKGGSFSVDTSGFTVSSHYIEHTAIVEFIFEGPGSQFKILDFMVPLPDVKSENHLLVRKFIGNHGHSQVNLRFNPQPQYANSKIKLQFAGDIGDTDQSEDRLLIYPPEEAEVSEDGGYQITFNLHAGQECQLVMEYVVKGDRPIYSNQLFDQTTTVFWRNWVDKGSYFDFCKERLIRSAITLKLMQFYPTGAFIAAPTTSLPEEIGGERNWDYRFFWIRDATFTIYALHILGHTDEAVRFFDFIQNIVENCQENDFDISLMYTINGQPVPSEKVLENFSGYQNSKPVRVGNGAKDQFQLDVYGSLIDAYYFTSKRGIEFSPNHRQTIINLAKKIKQKWQQKDRGIWEVRSDPQHFTHSKVMCWVGINRLLRMTEILGLTEEQVKEYQKLESDIKDWIWTNCYDPEKKVIKQYPETNHQDATNFLMVLLQFLDKHDPRTKQIIEESSSELLYKELFVYRYFTDDGLVGNEGAFVLCSFWLISALAILEETDRAMELFQAFGALIAETGLLSEEIEPDSKDYLGNFPQAFSHIGYIMSAYYIDRYSHKKS